MLVGPQSAGPATSWASSLLGRLSQVESTVGLGEWCWRLHSFAACLLCMLRPRVGQLQEEVTGIISQTVMQAQMLVPGTPGGRPGPGKGTLPQAVGLREHRRVALGCSLASGGTWGYIKDLSMKPLWLQVAESHPRQY